MNEKFSLERYDPKRVEDEVREFWREINLPELLKKHREGRKKFFLLDGPPYVNAVPHVGNIKTTTCKDIWSKIMIMRGFDAWLQPGFDCHGLPVEVMVEKELGIENKSDIEKIGIEKFIEKCYEKILNNEKTWMECYRLLGAWRGFYRPYFTYEKYYIEAGWWTLKKLHERGLLVEGEKPIHWCPKCETALSGYEVSDAYRNLTDPSLFFKVRIKGRENEFFLVWTTTPWTLPGNVALAVHPEEEYVKIKMNGEYLILAKKRLEHVVEGEYEVVSVFKGEELDGLEYEPVLDITQQKEIKHGRKVVLSVPIMKSKSYGKHGSGEDVYEEFVNMDEGTGIVHVAPGHGPADFLLGKYYGLDVVSPVDESGRFTEKADWLAGRFVKDAENEIIEKLDSEGRVFKAGKITHSYPVCWRCKTPLIFRISKQWYLKVDPIKDKMLSENEKVKWMPGFGQKRFERWIAEREDWCISQQRYWGIPMPVWVCKCGKKKIIGSVSELAENAVNFSELDDLHRHRIDGIKLRCDCGGEMERVRDIFNVWYDSGIAPWASLGYPSENRELFEKLFPCDLIVEGQDQIRGWFDSLMFLGVSVFDRSPYKSVGMVGWVVDEKGEKMSKSVGNVVWARDALEKFGGDVLRFYYCFGTPPWEVQRFSPRICEEIKRYLNILWNIFVFFQEYRTDASGLSIEKPEDAWIVSRVNTLVKRLNEAIDSFEFHRYGKLLQDFFVEDLSRWYIKSVRDRIKSGDASAVSVLSYVLHRLVRLCAPVIPFVSEYLYQRAFGDKTSVHLEDWPECDESFVNAELEEMMEEAKKIVEACLSERKKKGIKLRYPLRKVTVYGDSGTSRVLDVFGEMIKKLANVKEVVFSEFRAVSVKPNFSSLGKKFREKTQTVAKAITECDASWLEEELRKNGKAVLDGFEVSKDDVQFVYPESVVELDTEADEELKKEWLLRELIRAVHEARKEVGLKHGEKARLYLPEELSAFSEEISAETSCEVTVETRSDFSFEFEGKTYSFGLEKA
ncbi:MAG: isoleucine--tRNA ligase [Candidatus Micrarchaeota archaeon]|nr:isoleucine--tRNA ligase [Candidatus Micrarchaeota archaeon]